MKDVDFNVAVSGTEKAIADFERLRDSIGQIAKDGLKSSKACADLARQINSYSSKQSAHAKAQLKFYKELGQLSGNYGNSVALQNSLIEEQARKYHEVYGISEELVAQWEYYQKLQISTDPFDGAYRGLLKFTSEYGDQAKTWEDLTYNFAKSFVDQTGDMFDEFLETGKISLDGFQSLFKSFLKQLAWQAIAQPIMVNIVGSLFGTGGGSVAGAAGLAGGMASAAGIGGGGGSGNSLVDVGMGIGKQYLSSQIFGGSGSGGLMGGITGAIDSAMASMFPNTFATADAIAESVGTQFVNSVYASDALTGLTSNAASQVPCTTFTQAAGSTLANFATPGLGAGIGAIASPFVNNLLGIENNQGASTGAMIGGLGATAVLGTLAAVNAWNPVGWISAGLAGLSAIAGGALGGALGTQPKQEPKLEVDLVGSLWKPVSGELQDVGGWGQQFSFWRKEHFATLSAKILRFWGRSSSCYHS